MAKEKENETIFKKAIKIHKSFFLKNQSGIYPPFFTDADSQKIAYTQYSPTPIRTNQHIPTGIY